MGNSDNNPSNGLQGSSYIYDYGASPNTRTAVSQKVRLLAPSYGAQNRALYQMGVVSQFTPSQSRTVDAVRGIGYGDIIAELVPSVTEQTTGNIERALLYLQNLWQSVGYAAGVDGPVRSLAHHRWPFDIEQQLVFSSLADADLGVANQGTQGTGFRGGQERVRYPSPTTSSGTPDSNLGHSAIITMYEACWFTSWSAPTSKDSGAIMETGDVAVTDVHDFSSLYGEFLATGNDPTVGQLGSIRYGSAGPGGGTPVGGSGPAGRSVTFAGVTSNLTPSP